MTALLRDYTHDGRTTLLLDGRALYLKALLKAKIVRVTA